MMEIQNQLQMLTEKIFRDNFVMHAGKTPCAKAFARKGPQVGRQGRGSGSGRIR